MGIAGIEQPIEGAHPPKGDVPDPPATSAVAGEGKAEPAESAHTTHASSVDARPAPDGATERRPSRRKP